MINPFKEVNWNPDRAAVRKFAVSLIIGFPCLALLLWALKWLTGGHPNPHVLWALFSGTLSGIVFWLLPDLAKPFYLAWYFLACSVGIVVSNVILAGFYYVAITPVGLLLRACGRQLLRKRFDKNVPSYWVDAPKQTDSTRYYRQY